MHVKSIISGIITVATILSVNAEELKLSISPHFPVQGQQAEISLRLSDKIAPEIKQLKVKVIFKGRESKEITEVEVLKRRPGTSAFSAQWHPLFNGTGQLEVNIIDLNGKALSASQEISVLGKPIFIPWWIGDNSLRDQVTNLTHVLSKPEDKNYWIERGIVPCAWKGTKTDNAEKYVEYLKNNLPAGFGIMIDEIGGYEISEQKKEALKGIQIFKKKYPDIPIFVYGCGSLKPEVCNAVKNIYRKNGIDKLMIEAYHDYQIPEFNAYLQNKYFDQRINMARDYDVLANSVMILGTVGSNGYKLVPEILEQQFRYVKMNAPEMSGIGFYKAINKDLTVEVNRLCQKYYISPVLTSWDKDIIVAESELKTKQASNILIKIYNIGGTDAYSVKIQLSVRDLRNGNITSVGSKVLDKMPVNEGIPAGVANVHFKWTPESEGYYELIAEILEEEPNVTILNGRIAKQLYIRR